VHKLQSAAVRWTAQPHAHSGIACSVCTVDLEFHWNIMQCKEIYILYEEGLKMSTIFYLGRSK